MDGNAYAQNSVNPDPYHTQRDNTSIPTYTQLQSPISMNIAGSQAKEEGEQAKKPNSLIQNNTSENILGDISKELFEEFQKVPPLPVAPANAHASTQSETPTHSPSTPSTSSTSSQKANPTPYEAERQLDPSQQKEQASDRTIHRTTQEQRNTQNPSAQAPSMQVPSALTEAERDKRNRDTDRLMLDPILDPVQRALLEIQAAEQAQNAPIEQTSLPTYNVTTESTEQSTEQKKPAHVQATQNTAIEQRPVPIAPDTALTSDTPITPDTTPTTSDTPITPVPETFAPETFAPVTPVNEIPTSTRQDPIQYIPSTPSTPSTPSMPSTPRGHENTQIEPLQESLQQLPVQDNSKPDVPVQEMLDLKVPTQEVPVSNTPSQEMPSQSPPLHAPYLQNRNLPSPETEKKTVQILPELTKQDTPSPPRIDQAITPAELAEIERSLKILALRISKSPTFDGSNGSPVMRIERFMNATRDQSLALDRLETVMRDYAFEKTVLKILTKDAYNSSPFFNAHILIQNASEKAPARNKNAVYTIRVEIFDANHNIKGYWSETTREENK